VRAKESCWVGGIVEGHRLQVDRVREAMLLETGRIKYIAITL